MKNYKSLVKVFSAISILWLLAGCSFDPTRFYPEIDNNAVKTEKPLYTFIPITGLRNSLNDDVRKLLIDTAKDKNRKIAVFSVDGVILNQVPYSAADEAMLEYAKAHPDWKPELLKKILSEDRDTNEYINSRALYWSGLPVKEVEQAGYDTFRTHFYFFPGMYDLLGNLSANGFEIWVITSAPEVLYQHFLSDYLNIPKYRIIGTKTLIKNEILTDELVGPNMDNSGKAEALQTFIKDIPLLVVGGSFRDADMMQLAKRLIITVNPDNKVPLKSLNDECLDVYATKSKWKILDIKDVKTERAQGMVSSEFGLKPNETINL